MIELLPLLAEREDGLVAHFATRTGGVSEGPYDSLNLGLSTGDRPEHVIENRRRLGGRLAAPLSHWLVAGQVHGARVLAASAGLRGLGTLAPAPAGQQADAIFLDTPGVFALSLSADCPLVAIVHRGRRLAGVAHAGWRGTAAGVVENLVGSFRSAGAAAHELEAGISPGICARCYPVGAEVWAALAHLPEAREPHDAGGGLDLRRVQRGILLAAGMRPDAIRIEPECSSCGAGRFFSHRRDRGTTGRTGALVGWRE